MVTENWRRSLDSKASVGTAVTNLSLAYDCLPYDLLIAKLDVYGTESEELKLIYSLNAYVVADRGLRLHRITVHIGR